MSWILKVFLEILLTFAPILISVLIVLIADWCRGRRQKKAGCS